MPVAPPSASSLIDTTAVNNVETSIDATLSGVGYYAANVLYDREGLAYWQLTTASVLNDLECFTLAGRYTAVGWRRALIVRNSANTQTIIKLFL